MPLYQVIENEETGKKDLVIIPGYGNDNNAEALEIAQESKDLASTANSAVNTKVSKFGDTMTGSLNVNLAGAGNPLVTNVQDHSHIVMRNMEIDITEVPDAVHASNISFRDKNNQVLGYLQYYQEADIGDSHTRIFTKSRKASTGTEINGELGVVACVDGSRYASAPPPRENSYANDVDTLRASVNRHPHNITKDINIFVNPDSPNASDTQGLFAGRGFSEDKPFASLLAAFNFVNTYYSSLTPAVAVNVQADCEWKANSPWIYFRNRVRLFASSNTSIHLNVPLSVAGGHLQINQANFVANAVIDSFLAAEGLYYGHSHLSLMGSVSFNGEVKYGTLYVRAGGFIDVHTNAKLSGTVTGPRYSATAGSKILVRGRGLNAIPGTVAGTCDATSVYG